MIMEYVEKEDVDRLIKKYCNKYFWKFNKKLLFRDDVHFVAMGNTRRTWKLENKVCSARGNV